MAKKKKVVKANGGIKARVMKYLKQGKGPTEAAKLAGCSLTTARYHAKRLGGVAVSNTPKAKKGKAAVEVEETDDQKRLYELSNEYDNLKDMFDDIKRKNKDLVEENTRLVTKANAYKELITDKL